MSFKQLNKNRSKKMFDLVSLSDPSVSIDRSSIALQAESSEPLAFAHCLHLLVAHAQIELTVFVAQTEHRRTESRREYGV